MKIFIPELGTKLKLNRNLKVSLKWEPRNFSAIAAFFPSLMNEYSDLQKKISISGNLSWQDGIRAVCTGETLEHHLMMMQKGAYRREFFDGEVLVNAKKWLVEQRKQAYKEFDDFGKSNPLITTLSKGTILEVDRIYIRKGASDFSSLTFKIRNEKVLRFWIPLEKVNQINCIVVI